MMRSWSTWKWQWKNIPSGHQHMHYFRPSLRWGVTSLSSFVGEYNINLKSVIISIRRSCRRCSQQTVILPFACPIILVLGKHDVSAILKPIESEGTYICYRRKKATYCWHNYHETNDLTSLNWGKFKVLINIITLSSILHEH